MLATIKSGEAAARRDLRLQLVCERLTGVSQENGFTNAEMQWGCDHEDEARSMYEAERGVMVRQTGFLAHTSEMAGASLDGDVDDFAGIIEIKAPKSSTHLRTLRAGVVPSEYLNGQITHNLWLTGADWCDFVSYDPRMPERLRLFVCRVMASSLDLAGYEKKLRAFLQEVDTETEALQTLATADPFARMAL
jgi:hypothetical protein